jgi:DNA modification methylase
MTKSIKLAELPGIASKIELWPLKQLKAYPNNPYTHADDDLDRIERTIREVGFLDPISVEAGEIIDGHARLLVAERMGLDKVPVIPFDHLSAAGRRVARLAFNKLGELRAVDVDKMIAELELIDQDPEFDLEVSGFTDAELQGLLEQTERDVDGLLDRELEIAEPAAHQEEDFKPETLEDLPEPVVQLGDLFEIGPHRLMVADAFDMDAIARLLDGVKVDAVVTDPPFAIFGSSTGVSSDVADDKMIRPFFDKVIRTIETCLKSFGQAFTFTDWRTWATFHEAGKRSGLTLSNLLVWDKGDFGMGSNYRNCHELIGFWQQIPKQRSHMDKKTTGQRATHQPNILRFARARLGESDGFSNEMPRHSAAKPTALLRRLIENATEPGQRVLDPMVGMGSTLVAAAASDRLGLAIEIEPKWAEVSLQRLERTTGLTARLEGTGETLAELRKKRHRKSAK